MKIRCFEIEWETDGEDVFLPTEVTVALDSDVIEELRSAGYDEQEIVNELGADSLSDSVGWLVQAYSYELVA